MSEMIPSRLLPVFTGLVVVVGCRESHVDEAHRPPTKQISHTKEPKPAPISQPKREQPHPTTLAGSASFTCTIEEGRVYCWGGDYYGQLGHASRETKKQRRSTRAFAVHGLSDAISFAAGEFHGCASRRDRSLVCWGRNDSGQIGDGTKKNRSAPTKVAGVGAQRTTGLSGVVEVSAGTSHTCARTRTDLYCWGSLGGPNATRIEGPTNIIQLAAGAQSQCALEKAGRVLCFGSQSHGQLGNGVVADTQTKITPVLGIEDAVELQRHAFDGCVRHRDGTVSCWGWNLRGAVGEDMKTSSKPIRVKGIEDAQRLWPVGGGYCVRRTDETVWCWGNNEAGFGDEPPNKTVAPRRVMVFERGEPMTATGFHSCIREPAGTISCWGQNWNGQLGNGSLTATHRPTTVLGLPKNPTARIASTKTLFTVTIEQNGHEPPVKKDKSVTIKRAPFVIRIDFHSGNAVFVGASHDPASFTSAITNARAEKIKAFAQTGMADHPFNPNRTLMLSDEAPNLWYNHGPERHRFDGPCAPKGERTECRRTVEKIWYGRDDVRPLAQVDKDLFFVFAAQREESRPDGPSEVFRIGLRVRLQ